MEKLEKVVAQMENAFRKAADKFPEGSLEIKKEKAYDAFLVKESDPALRLFKGACSAAGFPVKVAPSGGGSDANWFGTKGFPSVLVGVGMADFHTNKENLKEKDLYDAGELVYRIIEAESHFGK